MRYFHLPPAARAGALGLLLAASLAACSPPADKTGAADVTLPANAAARDSMQAALTAPAPDAASTRADSAADRTSATPR